MQCYKHMGTNAVARCQSHGKGLCNDCADRFTLMLCQSCLLENNQQSQKRVITSFVIAIVFAAIGIVGGSSASGFWGTLGYAYLGFSVRWGYPFFGRFISAPYYKAVLALFLDWASTPFSIYRYIKELTTIQAAKQDIGGYVSV